MKELSNRTATFTDSVIRRMTRVSMQYDAVNLSQGFPDFEPPKELLDRLAQVAYEDYHQYSITWGSQNFREALAAKQTYFMGRRIDPNTEIVTTCGSTEAMMAAMMTVTNPGDKVIIFSPFYENYGADTILSGAEPIYVPLVPPDFHFDANVLEDAFRQHPKAIILCNPSNPCGKVFTREELEIIASLAEKYDTYVITDEVYEAKILYRTSLYNDVVRTFCMNPYGYVVAENTDGIITVNGHSYRDPKMHSKNTNFALLVSSKFTEPFHEPLQYGKRIASFSNMLGGGVLVQRFGDLVKGRRTNEKRMLKSFTKPTLSATPGDLSLVLPKRHLDDIIEMIYALDKIAPGMANADTLLYGVEVKFYSARLELDSNLETKVANMFAVGDGAGITRGLSQASASGVWAARVIGARACGQKN